MIKILKMIYQRIIKQEKIDINLFFIQNYLNKLKKEEE